MWKSLSIAKKIWFSLSILILGYFASTVFIYFNGTKTQKDLYITANSYFPAAMKSQQALNAFKEQMKMYNDAIMLGDSDIVASAGESAAISEKALSDIAGLPGVTAYTVNEVQQTRKELIAYTEEAQKIYGIMSEDSDTDVGDKAMKLAEKNKDIRKQLTKFTQKFEQELKDSLAATSKKTADQSLYTILAFVFVVGGACIIIWIIVRTSITLPLTQTVSMIRDVAEGEGDLTRRLKVQSKDEVGELAKWFNVFIERLQDMISDIATNAVTLTDSSSELSQLSGVMSTSTDSMSEKADTVASSMNQLNSNMDSAAAAMEQASTNTNMVATAAEEMTATINEIASNTENATIITNKAVTQTQSASSRVEELGKAAQEIGKVTETITEISEQTNLLALNATIEAARAGEAGKGFAVVANEIKELAKQTADATQDIKQKIGGIQTSTGYTVTDISEISTVINDVNDIVSTIATAVEEQSATTQEIANNVVQVSQGIQEVTSVVSDSSSVAASITDEIGEVNTSAGDVSNGTSQINISAEKLSDLAMELKSLVSKFKV